MQNFPLGRKSGARGSHRRSTKNPPDSRTDFVDTGFAPSVRDQRRHLVHGDAVDLSLDVVLKQRRAHAFPVVAAADERIADGLCVQRGEEVAVDGGGLDHAPAHVDLELHLAAREAARALDVELGIRAEDALPGGELLLCQLADARVVLGGDSVLLGAAVHDVAHHARLEGVGIHGRGQVFGYVGHAVAHGLDALGEDLVVVHGGGGHHLLDVGVEQERAVVHDAVTEAVLGVAGELAAVDGQVVAAVEGGVHAHLPQRVDHRGDVLVELNLPRVPVLDEGELPAAEVGVDRAAAAHAPHQMDAVGVGVGLVDLLQHVLILAHHQRGRGLPEQEHRVRQALFHREVVLQAEVVVNVRGAGLNIDHARPPVPPRPCRSCAPAARRPRGGSPY